MPNPSRWAALLAGKPRRPVVLLGLTLVILAGTLTPLLVSKGSGASAKRDRAAPRLALNQPAPAGEQPEQATPDLTAMLRRLTVGTVVVLLLCVATLWGCARWLKHREQPQGEQMQVLARLALDRRSHVFLVRARGQRLLAGVDVHGLKALVPVGMSGEEAEAEVRKEASPCPT